MGLQKTLALSAVAAGIMLSLSGAQAAPLLSSSEPMTINASDLAAKEKALTDFPLMEAVKSSIQTLDNSVVEQIEPGRAANPANVKRVESILTEADWDYLFPMRAPEYTYSNFLKAIGKFPAVCGTYTDGRDSDAICRKTLATMFAHFAKKRAVTKVGVIFRNGVRLWSICAKSAGQKGRKAATTANVTLMYGKDRPGRAVKIKTAISSAILVAGKTAFL
ncbi:secreted chitinase [Salmonella enterica subsp. arizonae]|uniref:Secreted chitinase n=1 Tax=Salmonella enterica subsp. arizonae TaxID=59203 RepID=A0A2X4TYR7_SALER|nr:secreted chitinase [Salmonella enterica subsp. arizonae]